MFLNGSKNERCIVMKRIVSVLIYIFNKVNNWCFTKCWFWTKDFIVYHMVQWINMGDPRLSLIFWTLSKISINLKVFQSCLCMSERCYFYPPLNVNRPGQIKNIDWNKKLTVQLVSGTKSVHFFSEHVYHSLLYDTAKYRGFLVATNVYLECFKPRSLSSL